MGASGWQYRTKYAGDAGAALEALRQQVFDEHDYYLFHEEGEALASTYDGIAFWGHSGDRGDTPTQHVRTRARSWPMYCAEQSWFGCPSRAAVVRGNPVRSRDCPAAVSGNDRRHEALGASLGSDGQ